MKCLALGGGGLALFATLGHINRLHDSGNLTDLEELSGASAGAMVAVGYALYREHLFEKMMSVDSSKFFKLNIQTLIRENGLSSMNGCRDEFIRLVGPGAETMTLSDLYEQTGLKVHIAAFSLEKNSTDYFSAESAPTMKVLDALCKSCCVPILFVPQDGHVDGGLCEKIPIVPFIHRPYDDVYTVRVHFASQKQSYFKQLMSVIMSMRYECPMDFRCVHIDLGTVNVFDFKMSSETKRSLFLKGYSHPICTA